MSDHFFSRWSRRKQEAAQGLPLPEPETVGRHNANAPPKAVPEPVPAPAVPEAPLPTLADAQALTPESEFGAFMRQGVPADVRNLAVKKLFADPHFNVMDGLDIYIGDYTIADPLPAGMLEKMVSAQAMKLVPEIIEPRPTSGSLLEENPELHAPDMQSPSLVAQSAPLPVNSTEPDLLPSEHDNPDLQLQPNHAPAGPEAGPGAG
ncbi:DUF3306 domain-containing protein [Limnohabitans lacus]|uniref:DUF3306 domain-containing protein n=1 Tax=Limnohabitans lacus TaxID=3045173 RepID=A0ABT6XA48_9BURK|nr:DUF3306 domain-containing protein [Limnohabitans sp. HM2-2]MDI9234797.1 DUF3306 domain-containing protein [Limnohabitans sp. HM2-2]